MSISKSLRVLTGKMIFVIFAHIKRSVLLLSQPKKKKKHTKIILILYSINCYVRNSKPIYLMSEQTCVPNINNVWHTNETYQQLRSAQAYPSGELVTKWYETYDAKEYKVILTESCMLKVTLGPGDAASTRISGRSSLSPSRELLTKTKHNIFFSFITGFCVHANI